MAQRDYRKGALPYGFVPIPKDVLLSPEWQGLRPSARILALDLMGQYSGRNNGKLCPAFEAMRRCGWKAERTLIDAKRALLECSFVVHTRQGRPPHVPDWLAFTWWKLDYHESMEVDPRKFPYLNFVKVERVDPNTGRQKPLP